MTFGERFSALSLAQALMGGLVIATLYYFIGYNSGAALKAQIEAAQTTIKTTETQIAEENKKIERIEQYKKSTQIMGESFQTLLTYIPAKLASFDLMKAISNEAKASGVNLVRVAEAGQPTKKGFYQELSVQVDLKGNFQQLMLFLSFLTRTEQFLTVHNLELTSDPNASGRESPTLRFSTEIHGYRYDQTETPK